MDNGTEAIEESGLLRGQQLSFHMHVTGVWMRGFNVPLIVTYVSSTYRPDLVRTAMLQVASQLMHRFFFVSYGPRHFLLSFGCRIQNLAALEVRQSNNGKAEQSYRLS